jgi:hypothetical protein
VGDSWKKIRVYFNGSKTTQMIKPDSINWKAVIVGNKVVMDQNSVEMIGLAPYSCSVLYQ